LFNKALQFYFGPDGKGKKLSNRSGDRGIKRLAPVTGRRKQWLLPPIFS
jgi:hypothetical protein